MIYFTSDQHFGHQNIIKYCRRPFKTANQMDSVLIKNYNEVVSNDDTVYFVGDLSICRKSKKDWLWNIVDKLKGIKHLILGNHDYMDPFDYVNMGFVSVHTLLDIGDMVLAHDPSKATVVRNKVLVCGHVHDLFVRQRNAVNVGVDVRDFRPVSIDTIYSEFQE